MGRWTWVLLASGWGIGLGGVGCTKQKPPPPAICSAPQGSAAAAQSLASADLDFAVALCQPSVSAAGAAKNLIFSPYSVSSGLTMVEAGAAGETATQLQTVLHLPDTATVIAPAYAALACEDETDGAVDGQTLTLANAVWAQQGETFKADYLALLAGGYGAPLQQVDFAGNASAAASAVNEWISTQTNGEIPTLLAPDDITSKTRLVLVNAVYFKGTWLTSFDPSQTSPQPFTLADQSQVEVPMMHGTVDYAIGQSNGFSVYELPYDGGGLVLDILMPDGHLSDFEASLTRASLDEALGSLGAIHSCSSSATSRMGASSSWGVSSILGSSQARGLGAPHGWTQGPRGIQKPCGGRGRGRRRARRSDPDRMWSSKQSCRIAERVHESDNRARAPRLPGEPYGAPPQGAEAICLIRFRG